MAFAIETRILTGVSLNKANSYQLLKVLGVAFGLAMIIGNTIGVGILRSPGEVAAALPSATWFICVWVVGGVYALLGAMTQNPALDSENARDKTAT